MFFFFDEVETFLQESLNKQQGESYEKEKALGSVRVDFFLPYGCAKLNYPPNTVIEVVNSPKSGTLYQARKCVTTIKNEAYAINAYYIYCKEITPEYLPLRSSRKPKDIIHVVDFNTLQSQKKRVFENDDYWTERQKRIRSKAKQDFAKGRNSLFLGAGVSMSCGLPGWDKLLESLLTSLRLKKVLSLNDANACENDNLGSLLVKARYLKKIYSDSKQSFISDIRHALYNEGVNDSPLIHSISALIKTMRIESVITYNFDDLVEEVLQREGVSFTPVDKSNRPDLGTLPILHTHGFIPREEDSSFESNIVLSEEDYHSLYRDAYHWANVEQLHALTQTTCYFIGLSLKDPSLRRLLDIAFERSNGNAMHYAFLPRSDYKEPQKAEDLYYNMGINVIWYEKVGELPQLVKELAG